jgi:hypothetical protein
MVILTPVERETLQVFWKEKPAHTVALICRYGTIVANMVDRGTLTRMWNEMNYRIHVCRITKGRHIEHLRNYVKKKLAEFLSLLA